MVKLKLPLLIIGILMGGAAALPSQSGAQISVSRSVETRDLTNVAISPDGGKVAVRLLIPSIAANSWDTRWVVADLTGPPNPRTIADGGAPLDLWHGPGDEPGVWSLNSVWFYFRRADNGNVQVWRARADGTVVQEMTQGQADVAEFTLSADGRVLAYALEPDPSAIAEAQVAEERTGILYDNSISAANELTGTVPVNGKLGANRIEFNSSTGQNHRTAALGGAVLRFKFLDFATGLTRDGTEVEYDRLHPKATLAGGDERIVQSVAQPGGATTAEVAALGELTKNIYGDPAALSYGLRAVAVGSQLPTVDCSMPVCSGQSDLLSIIGWYGREVVFANVPAVGDPRTEVFAWDPRRNRLRTIVQFDGSLSGLDRRGLSGCPVAGRNMICIAASASQPPELTEIDLSSGKLKTIFDPNVADRLQPTPQVEHLKWADEDGQDWYGWLVWPTNYQPGRRFPLVITSYTCTGYLRGGTGDTTPELPLAESGMFVLCAHFNSDLQDAIWRFGQASTHNDHDRAAYIYKRAVGGWKAAIKLLNDRGLVDPQKVGISGLSFSSQAAVYAISHGDDFAAAATPAFDLLDPFVPFFDHASDANSDAFHMRTIGLPFPLDDPEGLYKGVSPALNAEKIHAPLLIQAADNEFRTTLMLYSNLMRLKKPVEMFIFPGEGHFLNQPAQKLAVEQRNVDWFRFWLQGYEDPNSQKAAQYMRWRKMTPP